MNEPLARVGEGALPQNIEAEQAVLGSLLIDPRAIEKVSSFLKPDDFYLPVNAEIYRSMLALHERDMPADVVTVSDHLEARDRLDDMGGPAYLASLATIVPTSMNVEHYARIVERLAVLRRLVDAGSRIASLGYDERLDAEEALEEAEKTLFDISRLRVTRDFQPLSRILALVYEKMDMIHDHESSITGLTTGYIDLDRLTSGLQRSDLIILAARPSMGKSSLMLNIAHTVAKKERLPVGIFSVEMSAEQLAHRLISIEGEIDSQKLRTGRMTESDWDRLVRAVGVLSDMPIFIDDTPSLSTVEMRSKARRLHAEQGLGLLIIDYLQLMQGGSRENRVQEISAISRALKAVARELEVPVMALSQLSRAPEQRPNHEPMLSDLRESGCLTGDTLVLLPNSGGYVRIDSLVEAPKQSVLAVDTCSWKTTLRPITRAFCTGRKPVLVLTTRTGRTIRATGNHKFLTIDGWRRLDGLLKGDRIAIPRVTTSNAQKTLSDAELALLGHLIGDGCTLPRHAIQYVTNDPVLADVVANAARETFGDTLRIRIHSEPAAGCGIRYVDLASSRRLGRGRTNPVAHWLRELGVFGLRSWEKRVPPSVFSQPAASISFFLRHLWATDGCIRHREGGYPAVYFATSSEQLARDVQSLLLRLGVMSTRRRRAQNGKGRDQHHVMVMGSADLQRFFSQVGAVGVQRSDHAERILRQLVVGAANTNRDVIPKATWRSLVIPAMKECGLTSRAMQASIGTEYCGSTIYKANLSRARARRVAVVVRSEPLRLLAESDVYWDEVLSIEPGGEEDVYDLTIEDLHNFVANDIFVHNSIEQDADVVMFIYRDKVYNPDTEQPNVADVIIAKHRNGPTGKIHLFWQESLMKFNDLTPKNYEP